MRLIANFLVVVATLLSLCPPPANAANNPPVTVVPNVGNVGETESAVLSPDGQLLATINPSGMKLWDVASGRRLRSMEYPAFFLAVAFSPDGKTIASAHKDGSIQLWDPATGTRTTLQAAPKPGPDQGQDELAVQSLAFHAKGNLLVTGSRPGIVALWDLRRQKGQVKFKEGRVTAVRISPDGNKLIVTGQDTVRLFDVKTLAPGTSFKLPKNYSFAEDSIVDADRFVVRLWRSGCSIEQLLLLDLRNPTQLVPIDKPDQCNPPDDNADSSFGEPKIFVNADRTKLIAARNGTDGLKIWNLQAKQLERTIKWENIAGENLVAVWPDWGQALTFAKALSIRKLESGQLVRELISYGHPAENAGASRDGRHLFLSHEGPGNDHTIDLWQVNTLEPKTIRLATSPKTTIFDVAADGKLAVSVSDDDGKAVLLPTGPGQRTRTLPVTKDVTDALFAPNGRSIALVAAGVVYLIEVADGTAKLTVRPKNEEDFATSVTFSANGKLLAIGRQDGSAEIWSTESFKQIKKLPPPPGDNESQIRSLVFSDDGQLLVGGTRDAGVSMWNVTAGRWVRMLDWNYGLAGHVNVSSVAVSHDRKLIAAGLAERARSSGDVGAERGIKVWEADTGKLLFTLRGHEYGIRAVTFAPDDRRIVSASYDGSIRYWDRTGKWLATFTTAQDDRWLMVTESGFFSGSSGADDLIGVVQGLVPYSVSQFRDHLYRSDLVEEFLKGDPTGKYADAASKLNLQKVLDSGPAPQIELLDKRTEQSSDTVRLSVRITDTGGGIGSKVVWRVNGKTQGELTAAGLQGPANPGRTVVMTQGLKVDPGRSNTVEITAYNADDLLASLPFKLIVDPFGVTTQERPRLYVLAIGVDKYAMQENELHYAVKDAQSFADALKTVGSSLFSKIEITGLYDAEVKKQGIKTAIEGLASQVKPTDVFVLFLSGHGRSIAGKYYFLQQDLDFAKGQTIERDAVSQDLWQDWLAKIPAQKTLLIFDTCESAAAQGLVRGADHERETAMGQLQNATGNNLIAAARQAALEGYRGHGVLTYTILTAFEKPQAGTANDRVDVDGLATYVGTEVPEITKSLYGFEQEPIRKLSGRNFPLGLKVMNAPQPTDCPDAQDFIVIRPERLREKPEDQAAGDRMLDPGYRVGVKFFGKWALLCRDGEKLGYIPGEAVLKPH